MEFLYELSQLRDVTQNMQTVIGSLNNVRDTVGNIKDRAIPIWHGEAEERFEDGCVKLEQMLERHVQTLSASRQTLVDSIAVYEATENANVGLVSDLSADNYF